MDALRCIFLTFCSSLFIFFALVGGISAEGGKFSPCSIFMQLLQSLSIPRVKGETRTYSENVNDVYNYMITLGA